METLGLPWRRQQHAVIVASLAITTNGSGDPNRAFDNRASRSRPSSGTGFARDEVSQRRRRLAGNRSSRGGS
jgi:hypothetical protein